MTGRAIAPVTDFPQCNVPQCNVASGFRQIWRLVARPRVFDSFLVGPARASPRPCDREEKGGVFRGLDLLSHVLVECGETAGRQIERLLERALPNAPTDGLDRDSPLRVVSRNARVRLEPDQDDTKSSYLTSVLAF